jgi:hypothetical protein
LKNTFTGTGFPENCDSLGSFFQRHVPETDVVMMDILHDWNL